MKRCFSSCVVFSALLLSLGCGSKEGAVVGKWKLDTEGMKNAALEQQKKEFEKMSPDERKASEAASETSTKMLEQMFEAMKGSIEIKGDGTYTSTSTEPMTKDPKTSQGTWKLEGDVCTFTSNDKEEGPKKMKLAGNRFELILSEEEKKDGAPAIVFIRQ